MKPYISYFSLCAVPFVAAGCISFDTSTGFVATEVKSVELVDVRLTDSELFTEARHKVVPAKRVPDNLQPLAEHEVRSNKIKQIFESSRCGDISDGGFIWFKEDADFDTWLSPLGGVFTKEIKSHVDFEKQGVLLIDFGVAPSSALVPDIVEEQVVLEDRRASITVVQKTIPEDSRRLGMITHPCSLHVIPRSSFDQLVVKDNHGDTMLVLE